MQEKSKFMYFTFFPSTKHVMQKFSSLLYIILLLGADGTGYLLQNFEHFYQHAHFAKVLQINIPRSTKEHFAHAQT
jgi:hypothetical protein